MRLRASLAVSLFLLVPLSAAFAVQGTTVAVVLVGVDDGSSYSPGAVVPAGQWMWLDAAWHRADGTPLTNEWVNLRVQSVNDNMDTTALTNASGQIRVLVPASASGPVIATLSHGVTQAIFAWTAGSHMPDASPSVHLAPEDAWIEVEVEALVDTHLYFRFEGAGQRPSSHESAAFFDLFFAPSNDWPVRYYGYGAASRGGEIAAMMKVGSSRIGIETDSPVAITGDRWTWSVSGNSPFIAGSTVRVLIARAGFGDSEALTTRLFAPPSDIRINVLGEGTFEAAATTSSSEISLGGIRAGPASINRLDAHNGTLSANLDVPEGSLLIGSLWFAGGNGAFTLERDGEPAASRNFAASPASSTSFVGEGLCSGTWHARFDAQGWGSRPQLVLARASPAPQLSEALRELARVASDCAFD